jgi:O-antigen ligase
MAPRYTVNTAKKELGDGMIAYRAALQMPGTGLRRVAVFPGTLSYALLLLFIVVLYASPGVQIKQLAAIGPALLLGGLALLVLAFEKMKNREGTWFVWPHSHLFAALIWTAGLSCFTAIWPRLSVGATVDLAKYFIIYLVIVNCVNSESRLKGVLWTMVLAGLFPCLGALHNYAVGNLKPGERAHWIGVFGNSNDLAYSIVLLVPLALALLDGLGGRWRPFLWGVIAVYTATIYITFSRGSVIGLMAVLLLIGIRHRSGSVRLVTFGAIAASLILITFFWSRQEGFTNLADFTLQQRLVQVRAGLEMFLDRPFLGVGLGGSVAAFRLYAPQSFGLASSFVVHNTFVLALSELGFFGCLFFALFVVTGLIDARRIVRAAKAEELLVTDLRGDTRNREFPTPWFRVNMQPTKRPPMATSIDGIATSLCGYIVCGFFGPYLMSWFPFILVGLVSAALKMRQQQDMAVVSAKDVL